MIKKSKEDKNGNKTPRKSMIESKSTKKIKNNGNQEISTNNKKL